jgi:prepilin-type N-terminal cleavage/methylation domain-containing protein
MAASARRGFTLLEAMLALTIVLVGVLAVVQAQQSFLFNNVFKGKAYGIMLYGNGKSDWAAPLTLGTADFFFVEDNSFEFDDFYGATGVPVMDMDAGGRQVFRHNTIRYGFWETHDLARSGLVSANAFELYNHNFTTTSNKWKAFDVSAGTGVIGQYHQWRLGVLIGAMTTSRSIRVRYACATAPTRPTRTFPASRAGSASIRSAA